MPIAVCQLLQELREKKNYSSALHCRHSQQWSAIHVLWEKQQVTSTPQLLLILMGVERNSQQSITYILQLGHQKQV